MRTILLAVLVLLISSPMNPLNADNCAGAGAVILDDALPDGFYQVPEAFKPVNRNAMAQNFRMPDRATKIKKVCVCLSREVTGPSEALVRISHLEGLTGGGLDKPKVFNIAEKVMSNIPVKPAWTYYSMDVDFAVTEFTTYGIGVDLPNNVLLCGDRTVGPEPYQSVFAYNRKLDYHPCCPDFNSGLLEGYLLHASWTWKENPPRQMGIRIQVESEQIGAGCIPTDETLCLVKGRFAVRMLWGVNTPSTYKPAKSASLSFADNSGLFYFNSPNNAEVLLKVLDACVPALGNKIWVFFAATTNVGYEIEIHDTLTGEVRRYDNDANTPALPVQDTSAFSCHE